MILSGLFLFGPDPSLLWDEEERETFLGNFDDPLLQNAGASCFELEVVLFCLGFGLGLEGLGLG